MQPQVCILLPHFNDFEGLQKSIASIGPTEKVDVLVVDDGSQEEIDEAAVKRVKHFDGKIYFLYFAENQGICKAMNQGLAWIQKHNYRYIARLDCGDTCGRRRFEKQQNFLETHPSVGLIGTWSIFVDKAGKGLFACATPIADTEIRQKIYWSCPFVHPSIMFRVEVLNTIKGYDERFLVGEDLPFYFEVIKYWQVANLPEYLLFYELNEKSISSTKREKVLSACFITLKEHFRWGIWPLLGLLKNILARQLPRNWMFKNRLLFRQLAEINSYVFKKWRFSTKK